MKIINIFPKIYYLIIHLLIFKISIFIFFHYFWMSFQMIHFIYKSFYIIFFSISLTQIIIESINKIVLKMKKYAFYLFI